MKRLFLIVIGVCLLVLGMTAATALADKPPAPPGKDPCSHGNTGKPCRPDPQPDKGKDCNHHGKEGGVNEDHCKGEIQPPTTPPTNPPPTNPPPINPPPTNPPPTITTGEPGKPVTVETTPGQPVEVIGPAVIVEKNPGTITLKPTKPGIIKVSQTTQVTKIGVTKRDEIGKALAG